MVRKARKIAMEYELAYGEEIPITQLVQKLAAVMQEYTQSGYFILSIFLSKYKNLSNFKILVL